MYENQKYEINKKLSFRKLKNIINQTHVKKVKQLYVRKSTNVIEKQLKDEFYQVRPQTTF